MVSRALGQLTQKHVCEHPYNAYVYSQTCTHGDRHTEAHMCTETRIHTSSHTQAYIHGETHKRTCHPDTDMHVLTHMHTNTETQLRVHAPTDTHEQTRTFTCPLNPPVLTGAWW